jgi:hypothetical protein
LGEKMEDLPLSGGEPVRYCLGVGSGQQPFQDLALRWTETAPRPQRDIRDGGGCRLGHYSARYLDCTENQVEVGRDLPRPGASSRSRTVVGRDGIAIHYPSRQVVVVVITSREPSQLDRLRFHVSRR